MGEGGQLSNRSHEIRTPSMCLFYAPLYHHLEKQRWLLLK